MNAFFESFIAGEILISSVVIFSLYYLYFNNLDSFSKDKVVRTSFFIILLLLFHHMFFQMGKYFFSFEVGAMYRTLTALFTVPLFLFFLFKVRDKVNLRIWNWVFLSYSASVFFTGIYLLTGSLAVDFFKTTIQLMTVVLMYVFFTRFLVFKW